MTDKEQQYHTLNEVITILLCYIHVQYIYKNASLTRSTTVQVLQYWTRLYGHYDVIQTIIQCDVI